jgi:hypothetical protein
MNKNRILLLLYLLFSASLFGEGFVSNTLVAISPGALQPMNKFCAGFDAYSLNEQGEMVLARITKMEKTEQYRYKIVQLEGGTEICGDWDQLFYCPNRGAWVKCVDLNAGEDSVYSYKQKKPLRVLSNKTFRTALFNFKVPIYRISLAKYGVYFVSKDLILVHNFDVILPTMGAIILAEAATVAVQVATAVVAAYVTEKVCEKVVPAVRDLMRSSPKAGDAGTPAAPNIDTDNKENGTPETPPPGGGGLDPSKIPPIIGAEETVRKNGEPAVKAVGNAVRNVADTVKNSLPGNDTVQAELTFDKTLLTNPELGKFKHIFGIDNGQWVEHDFDKIGKTASEAAGKLAEVVQRALDAGKIPQSGVYAIRDLVDGHTVEIRGRVIDGAIKIGTAFVDKHCC